MESNRSGEIASNNAGGKDAKRQQFTNKQRMDMYAFCVLELEMHSHKVSIKKQQQAIQRVLNKQQKTEVQNMDHQLDSSQPQLLQQLHHQPPELKEQPLLPQLMQTSTSTTQLQNQEQLPPQLPPLQPLQPMTITTTSDNEKQNQDQMQPQPLPAAQTTIPTTPQQQQQNQEQLPPQLEEQQQPQPITQQLPTLPEQQQTEPTIQQNGERPQQQPNDTSCNSSGIEGKTLLQLQQEVAMTRKCYSDYQKTQVLTSSMLRDVQKRFAKYYPDSAIPSRTTIKHVFEKCVAHGTVENIKTPRKATKIPQGDEIEFLLINEPQLSLRQMAQKLNVSTGTVSRRCKALGLVPESVTIKHQQLAQARRQKQIKQLVSQTKIEPTNNNGNYNNNDDNTTTPNGTHNQIGGDIPKYLSK